MLTSSPVNSVYFRNLANNILATRWNTLHANRKQGAFSVLSYWQKFDKGEVILLQFTSDSATPPELKSFIPALHDTLAPSVSRNVASTRYFYNFEITLDSHYSDKTIYFTVTQGTDVLTSEPIKCEELHGSDGKLLPEFRRIKYTNLDRNNSDLSDYWVDWSIIAYMFFYVEAVDVDPNDSDESEIIEGAQNKELMSANLFSGMVLKTGGIPDYMALKLAAASSLDVFEVNGVEYVKQGGVEQGRFGSSTLVQVELKLTAKNIIGLNVDDLGVEGTNTDINMPIVEEKVNLSSTWTVTVPAGYIIHGIWAKHAAGSVAATSVMIAGTTIGGSDIIDSEQGSIVRADYSTTWMPFPRHHLGSSTVDYVIYFTVTGAGSILHVLIHLESLIPTA